ncbi:MAG: serine/threonine protein kinase [Roseburia sp.]|nr:serine/threonine protein kinase [Roseburia sp.]
MEEIGRMLEGRYRLIRLLGKGGAAAVYLARDRRSGKYRAVKELRKGRRTWAETAAMLQDLYHPGLPRVWETIAGQGETVYVVMDYVEGVSLGRLLQEAGPQSAPQVIEWGKQLCRILIYLHSRKPPLLYRDLKPDNIMLQADGMLKLIDFGTIMQGGGRQRNDCLGTRGYAAPEQYVRRGRLDQRTDIYCLGVTLHRLLTGCQPARGRDGLLPLRRWNPSFSSELERILIKCTRKSPRRRYRSCRELLGALERL